MSILRQIALRTIRKILPVPIINQAIISSFHILNKSLENQHIIGHNLLTVPNVTVMPSCGFKVKGRLRRRCKDCYFVMRQQRLYVICKTHPRHKQMSMVKDERNTWILSHATQGKIRPW